MFHNTILILLFFGIVSASDEAIRIYVPGYKTDTIDFGMRYENEDRISKRFFIENNTSKTYFIGETAPTFATYQGPSGNRTHSGFEKPQDDNRIITILPGETVFRDVIFSYFDIGEDQAEFRLGMWDANLEIGLSTKQSIEEINKPEFVEYSKVFLLIGRVSNQDFDVWDKDLRFDSVFALSPSEEIKQLNFRNNSETRNIKLNEVDLEVLTSEPAQAEFILEELSLPIELEPRSSDPGNDQESINIQYSPVNRGIDSAEVEFESEIAGDIIISTATITGTGVVQELSLDNCTELFYKDGLDFVIDLGDIKRDEVVTLEGTLKNTGNMNFHGLSTSILGDDFVGNVEIGISNTFSIETDEFLSFSATISPNRGGTLASEFLFESDAKNRGIGSYVEAIHRFEKIKLIGRSIEPVLTTDVIDTLDFGVIRGTQDCLDGSIQEHVLKNIGLGELEIINAFTSDPAIFDVDIDVENIAPKSEAVARVRFLPGGNDIFREYSDESLYIVTNMLAPNDTLIIPLKAIFASPGATQLYIEDQSFFPGTRLKVPLIVDGDRINLADRFSTTLSYNWTLLGYNDILTQGTASEQAANTSFASISEIGRLEISINLPQGDNFSISDTLCFLEFDTFIGTSLESNMVFISPQFGDKDCNSTIEVNSSVGVISLDSLCFADQYVHSRNPEVVLNSVFPSPANEILNFNLYLGDRHSIDGKIEVLDTKGSIQIDENRLLLFGDNQLNISNLRPGVYLLHIITPRYQYTTKFLKID